jgi:hypothetical protein
VCYTYTTIIKDKNMELTKEYFDQQIKQFATKEYLDGKLSNFVVKDDLKQFATKKDLEKLAKKTDLDALESKLESKIDILESRIVADVEELIISPFYNHISQVKKVLILPEQDEREPMPIMLKDKANSKPYSKEFVEKWVSRKEREWTKGKISMEQRIKALKLLYPHLDKSFLNRLLNSAR